MTLSNTLCSRIALSAMDEVFAEDGSETIEACELGWTIGADGDGREGDVVSRAAGVWRAGPAWISSDCLSIVGIKRRLIKNDTLRRIAVDGSTPKNGRA